MILPACVHPKRSVWMMAAEHRAAPRLVRALVLTLVGSPACYTRSASNPNGLFPTG
jgi:hypothetical protein